MPKKTKTPLQLEFIYLAAIIENEGFDYTFRDYSDFEEVKDEKFHQLRQAYKDAADELDNYIGKMSSGE